MVSHVGMSMAPPINDISTDLDDPPELANGKPYPESFKSVVRRHYPDLAPLALGSDRVRVFERATEIARCTRGWRIDRADQEAGIIQGVAVTPLFRFRDDFTIRFRERDGKTIVDMRSRSRLGRGDLGTNAKRIRGFFAALR
jgi:uncharacterized protein (DUF1499 family)